MNRAERRRAERQGKTTDPLCITWYSNAVWANTGYGTQSAQVIPRLQAHGHHVAVAANYGLMATQMVYEGIPHYPMGIDAYSNDVIEPIYVDWNRQHPDAKPLTIALFDAWPLKGPAWDSMPVAVWTMIDHLPAPPAVLEFLRKPNVTPLAASRFAHEQISKAGVESIYVPMAIDTNLYRPTATWSNNDRAITGRELMGFDEDVFVVSTINANKSGNAMHRKAWAENLLAFSIFAAEHDDVRLYIHTEKSGAYGGVKFAPLLESLQIPKDRYRFVNQWAQHTGIPNEAMAALYTATDVLLAPTLGEGFGLTVIEAGACETPAIVSDFTCQPEMVSPDSHLVGGQPWWDSTQSAWWQIPNVGQIVEALEAAYARGRYRSPAQRQHVIDNYDADAVYETHWKPALAALTADPPHPILVDPNPPATWTRNAEIVPTLQVYIPAYRRPTLGRLLESLAPQLTDRVEVIVSDDDPAGSGYAYVREYLAETPARVDYSRRRMNLGPDANLLRGLEVGSALWVWQIGDDDWVLPGALDRILAAIDYADFDQVDRLILSSEHYRVGDGYNTLHAIATLDPSLPIAATLITANVVRRSALDLRLAHEKLDTMYACSWANIGCRNVRLIPEPCIGVGTGHVDGYAGITTLGAEGVAAIWSDLLRGYGIEPTPEAFARNYVNTAQGVA